MQCNNYSLNGKNLLFFCFNLLKSIIYVLSKLKFDINKKRDLSLNRKVIKRMVNNNSRFLELYKFVKTFQTQWFKTFSTQTQYSFNYYIASKYFSHYIFISWKPRIISFSIILWQAGKDFISRFTWPCLVSAQTHGYL